MPLTTEPVSTIDKLADLYKERATPEAVLAQIKSDIDKSLELFAGNNTFTAKRVYWNRAATLTLQGDVLIWSGTLMGGGNADLTKAKTALEEVKALSTLGLNANYADTFDPTKETNNKEIIFAISFEKDQGTQGAYSAFLVNTTQASTLILLIHRLQHLFLFQRLIRLWRVQVVWVCLPLQLQSSMMPMTNGRRLLSV